jgi:hypothetical protein
MNNPANYKQVLNHFNGKTKEVREYFPSFSRLLQDFPSDVSVSYVFSRVEVAKHSTIYCGMVKLHWTDSSLTSELVDRDHMSRGRFRDLFNIVFSESINENLLEKLQEAESVRDKIAHGKQWTPDQARKALIDVFDFAEGFNDFVYKLGGFKPFGGLRGFKGRKESLSKETTRWVLKGMGIPLKSDKHGVF